LHDRRGIALSGNDAIAGFALGRYAGASLLVAAIIALGA
jgi:hypothetical protein